MKKIVTVECDCKKGQEFCSGNKPEFYKEMDRAISRFLHFKNLNRIWAEFDQLKIPIPPKFSQYEIEKALYWAIHLNGMHIVAIKL